MPAWPKSFLLFGANLLTARTAMRLRRKDRGAGAQRAAYAGLLRRFAATSFWPASGVMAGMRYEDFRVRVPLRQHEAFGPAIDRMRSGEPGVLWPGRCQIFAATSGTSTGKPRILPVTAQLLNHFRAGCRDALLFYTARAGHAGVLRGRHVFLTGSTAVRPVDGNAGAFLGEWPAIAALNLPGWAHAHLYEPGTAIGDMDDWQTKLEATIARVATRDISLLAGMPTWTLIFADAMRAKAAETGQRVEHLQALWPNFECYVHGGVPIGPYEGELRAALGPTVNFHEVFAATEGMFAAQDTTANAGMRLMPNLGIFFEFLPLADYDESRLESLGDKCVALADVKAGTDYVLVISTPAGLARYVIGDIVRFTSTEPPRINYIGRAALQLTAFGERVTEKDVTDALMAICQRHRWTIVNFHVAPLFGLDLTGQTRGRHEWWVELKPGTVETPTGPQMAVELDFELRRSNPEYAMRRSSGRIEAPTVRLVMPGVFRHWLRFHGKWGAQTKIARCRSDRLLADELAQITRFARDQG